MNRSESREQKFRKDIIKIAKSKPDSVFLDIHSFPKNNKEHDWDKYDVGLLESWGRSDKQLNKNLLKYLTERGLKTRIMDIDQPCDIVIQLKDELNIKATLIECNEKHYDDLQNFIKKLSNAISIALTITE